MKLAYASGKRKPIRYWLGKKMPKEVGEKISKINKGRKASDSTKQKLREITLRRWREDPILREKVVKANTGKKQSAETIRKRVVQFTGESNWNWKGGITPLVRKIRVLPEMKKWVRECLERDSFLCTVCGSKKELEVDHIKPFSWIMSEQKVTSVSEALACVELWDKNNGRTLCRECHKKLQNKYHRIYADKVQISK